MNGGNNISEVCEGQHAEMQLSAKHTHRDAVVVQDPVLSRHKLEVDEMRSRPQHIVGHHCSDQLVLQMQPSMLLAALALARNRSPVLREAASSEAQGQHQHLPDRYASYLYCLHDQLRVTLQRLQNGKEDAGHDRRPNQLIRRCLR